jgi:glycosyltransferase involved in cell wall biosynthesis
MSDIIFSIIIPHRNIPNLLQRCLNSIPRRSDIQIIIVDDNSDEDKVDFNQFPGLEDQYVEVYLTKESKGAGYARNVGLKHAKGKWLLFADADDFFTKNAFEYLFTEMDSLHEIIYFKVTSCYSDTYKSANRDKQFNLLIDNFIYGIKNAGERIKYRHVVPWGKMIKAELIKQNHIIFDEIIASNDVMFVLNTGYLALSVVAVDNIIYCITRRNGSLDTMTNKNYNIFLNRYLVVLKFNTFLKERKLSQWQISTISYILKSIRFGFEKPFLFFYLALKNKNNPFLYKV